MFSSRSLTEEERKIAKEMNRREREREEERKKEKERERESEEKISSKLAWKGRISLFLCELSS